MSSFSFLLCPKLLFFYRTVDNIPFKIPERSCHLFWKNISVAFHPSQDPIFSLTRTWLWQDTSWSVSWLPFLPHRAPCPVLKTSVWRYHKWV
jgi:hypothetical protein